MSRSESAVTPKLDGYEVLIAVCGGIAAYKVCEVVSRLVQNGAGVTVAMTRSARRFVRPLTYQALSGRNVLTSMWQTSEQADIQHISLTDTADLMVVAPATANVLGKIAGGVADGLVSTLVISAASPVLLAPAMNTRMWENSIVQRNVADLKERGFPFVGPEEGQLACGTFGPGRMVEASELTETIAGLLRKNPPKSETNA